jgi:hypothetical protein
MADKKITRIIFSSKILLIPPVIEHIAAIGTEKATVKMIRSIDAASLPNNISKGVSNVTKSPANVLFSFSELIDAAENDGAMRNISSKFMLKKIEKIFFPSDETTE